MLENIINSIIHENKKIKEKIELLLGEEEDLEIEFYQGEELELGEEDFRKSYFFFFAFLVFD